MTDPIPYADYVRIEIHVGGKAQIIEFEPDDRQKVKAELTSARPPEGLIRMGDPFKQMSLPYLHLVLDVSGPIAKLTSEASDRG